MCAYPILTIQDMRSITQHCPGADGSDGISPDVRLNSSAHSGGAGVCYGYAAGVGVAQVGCGLCRTAHAGARPPYTSFSLGLSLASLGVGQSLGCSAGLLSRRLGVEDDRPSSFFVSPLASGVAEVGYGGA